MDTYSRADMIEEFYHLLNRWLELYETDDNSIANYLLGNNYTNIAIWGMGNMAEHLISYLRKSGINIEVVLDKRGERQYSSGIITYGLEYDMKNIDAVIYTNYYEDRTDLENIVCKYSIPVIYLGDLIFGNVRKIDE